MANATINLSKSASSGTYIIGKVVWSSVPDNDKNTSSVTAKLYVRKYNDSMTLTIPTSGKWSYSLTVNGDTVSGSVRKDILTDWVLLATKTITVNHNTDGAKSVTISGSVTAPSETSLQGHTTNGSGTAKLDTIPRATTIESLKCSTAFLNGTITATYTPQSASYYNRRIVYLNQGGTLTTIRTADLGQKSASQQTSTINLSDSELSKIYAKVTDTTRAILRVTFRTYSDSSYSAKIGSDQYLEITLTVPNIVAPTLVLTAERTTNNDWIAQKGIYVAGLTGTILTAEYTLSKGSSIKSTSISIGNTTYNSSKLQVATFPSAGNYTYTAKIVDSREAVAVDSKTITVFPYAAPAIASFVCERGTYDAGWTAAENGPDIRVTFKATLALTDHRNTLHKTFKLDNTSITPDHSIISGTSAESENELFFFDIDNESSHSFSFTITDDVGQGSTVTITIPTIHVTVEYNSSGKGIAFGKTSEKDAFECAWPAYFSGYAYTQGFRIPLVQWGTVSITPSASDTPTSKVVTFVSEFPGNPAVILTPQTAVPGTAVLGVGTSDRSTGGITVWATRTNTTATVVHWLAVY